MKTILAIVLALAAVAGAVLFWLSGNLDGLVRDAVTKYGSAMTQAKVGVDAVKIAPVDGKGTITGLVIGNPAGFKTAHAVKVGRIDIEIDPASVARDVIVIRRIAIEAPDVIYEKGEAMTNFDAIQNHIASYLGPADARKDDKGKKLIVEELTLRNAAAQASAAFMNGKTVRLPLPDITLKNLGKEKGGITAGELGQEITSAIKARLTAAVSFDRLMKSTGEALDKAGTAVRNLFK